MIPNLSTPKDAATYFDFKVEDTDNNDARCVTIDRDGDWRRTECGRRNVTSAEFIGVLCQRLPSKE